MKLLLLLLALPMIGFGQNVNIPNGIFKAYLVNNTAINTNGDYEIQVSEASVFNGGIYLYAGPGSGFGLLDGITDLTGIEAFVSLTYLDCSGNLLTNLDVSACIALTTLNCDYNQLTSLDVSANTALTTFGCSSNQLTSLDVSDNPALTILSCDANQLTSLAVSACTVLTYLACSSNQLTSLDVSECTALTTFNCSYNLLTSLDVRNGHNNWMVYYDFNASGNPNLSCIEVDDVQWSNSNWPYIDATASFSENCSAVGILDNDESTAILAYPNPTTGALYLSEPANISLSDLSGKLLLEEKNTNQLDLSALPAGMYFLHFGENNNQIVKVIKE